MTKEMIEIMVEEVMRDLNYKDYNLYQNEELREKLRKMFEEEEEDAGC